MKEPQGSTPQKWSEDVTTDAAGAVPGAPRPGVISPSTTAEIPVPTLPPSLLEALRQRVRFAGGELPLWSVIAPAFVAAAVLVALAAGAATAREVIVPSPVESGSAALAASASAPPVASSAAPARVAPTPPQELASAAPVAKKPLTPLERAAQGEAEALKTLEARPESELTVEEALAVAAGHAERDLVSARALREKLAQDPTLIKSPNLLAELYKQTQNPITAREALAAMASVPGPISADMLYEIWTGTPTKNDTTELARSLLLGKTIRVKASPALSVALDLRTIERCEDLLLVLPRAMQDGDKRSFVSLTKMQRKTGCGPGKRQDCYPCLHKGTELKDALAAVRQRREPDVFR
ncbi:MAG TPA: hypothetical protein VGP93_00635 [Polyangiaceae bacterium]|nr:hypothetical protein [Polyangiaceae bacterium]